MISQTATPTSPAPLATTATATAVCHISMTLATGGLERLLVDFARFGDRSRYPSRFVALEELGPPAREIRGTGSAVDSLQLRDVGKWTMLRNLAGLLRSEDISVVHTHNTYAHYYGAIAARLAGVPVVVNTQHGLRCGQTWKHRLQFRIGNHWTQRIIAVSHDAATLCRSIDPRSTRKIGCIWNGIDLTRFGWHGPRFENERFTAITVARLSPEKDLTTLLEAVALAIRECPQLHLLIVGDGPERSRLESLTRQRNLQGHVEFLGERHDVPQLLAQAGFFVSSSRIEGISLTLLEASAVGLPILATAVGGTPEIIDDTRTGRLVPAGDVASLSDGLVTMCRDRDSWTVMGELGRQRIERHFDVRRMVRDYESLYTELLAPEAPHPR